MDSRKTLLQLKNVSKTFNGKTIFSNVNLDIKEGEIIGIIGESGIGKSTLLKIIDKEINPDYDESIIFNEKIDSVLIPQQPALWDNLSVLENVSIVIQLLHNTPQKTANEEAKNILSSLKIKPELYKNYPSTLSGGEKQRISVARGLASEIKFMLFDEVTSNIDPENKNIVIELINNLSKLNYTIIFVTHDLFTIGRINCETHKLNKGGLAIVDKHIISSNL